MKFNILQALVQMNGRIAMENFNFCLNDFDTNTVNFERFLFLSFYEKNISLPTFDF